MQEKTTKPHKLVLVGLCVVPGRRFELLKAMPADLQSAPFGRSGNLACTLWCVYVLYYEAPTYLQIASAAGRNGVCRRGAGKQLAHAANGVIRELAQRLASGIFRQYGKLFFYRAEVGVNVL